MHAQACSCLCRTTGALPGSCFTFMWPSGLLGLHTQRCQTWGKLQQQQQQQALTAVQVAGKLQLSGRSSSCSSSMCACTNTLGAWVK